MDKFVQTRGLDVRVVVSVGDNIYPFGVHGVTDPLFESRFHKMYENSSVANALWLMSLGEQCTGALACATLDIFVSLCVYLNLN